MENDSLGYEVFCEMSEENLTILDCTILPTVSDHFLCLNYFLYYMENSFREKRVIYALYH